MNGRRVPSTRGGDGVVAHVRRYVWGWMEPLDVGSEGGMSGRGRGPSVWVWSVMLVHVEEEHALWISK